MAEEKKKLKANADDLSADMLRAEAIEDKNNSPLGEAAIIKIEVDPFKTEAAKAKAIDAVETDPGEMQLKSAIQTDEARREQLPLVGDDLEKDFKEPKDPYFEQENIKASDGIKGLDVDLNYRTELTEIDKLKDAVEEGKLSKDDYYLELEKLESKAKEDVKSPDENFREFVSAGDEAQDLYNLLQSGKLDTESEEYANVKNAYKKLKEESKNEKPQPPNRPPEPGKPSIIEAARLYINTERQDQIARSYQKQIPTKGNGQIVETKKPPTLVSTTPATPAAKGGLTGRIQSHANNSKR